ncbi:hypothetical protein [Pelagovum pacificum]|nr:hypothetical protein [Pelagovum pacificum]QQA45105.1 hypothetical protein I8N54_20060 [Pelagovum pacificum]
MKLHTDTYHAEIKRLRNENAIIEKQIQRWKADKGLKPSDSKFLGAAKTEAEIHKAAKEKADKVIVEQRKLDKAGLTKEQQDKLLRDFDGEKDPARMKAIRERARKKDLERQRTLRSRGGGGRKMDM